MTEMLRAWEPERMLPTPPRPVDWAWRILDWIYARNFQRTYMLWVYAGLAAPHWKQRLSSRTARGACSIERGSADVTDTTTTGGLDEGELERCVWWKR